jgi:dihydropteroate synthase
MVGLSRKSMIYKLLDISAEEALNGTTVLHALALQKGAHLLRVHDVKYAKECVQLWQALQ